MLYIKCANGHRSWKYEFHGMENYVISALVNRGLIVHTRYSFRLLFIFYSTRWMNYSVKCNLTEFCAMREHRIIRIMVWCLTAAMQKQIQGGDCTNSIFYAVTHPQAVWIAEGSPFGMLFDPLFHWILPCASPSFWFGLKQIHSDGMTDGAQSACFVGWFTSPHKNQSYHTCMFFSSQWGSRTYAIDLQLKLDIKRFNLEEAFNREHSKRMSAFSSVQFTALSSVQEEQKKKELLLKWIWASPIHIGISNDSQRPIGALN